MAYTVPRPRLSALERTAIPAVLSGMFLTLRHMVAALFGRRKVTMQYPEERWDAHLPDYYRGAPTLVRDEHGRERCVACQLCEFICPPRAIRIEPGELPRTDPWAKVEKFPAAFEIDMTRCIYCGMCEEVCPEQAIFLLKEYSITATTRAGMIHDKETLYRLGGLRRGLVHKWNDKK